MRILFDHQIFWQQHYGGISRYYVELIDRLRRFPGVDPRTSMWYSQNAHLTASSLIADGLAPSRPPSYTVVQWVKRLTGHDLAGRLHEGRSIKALKQGDYDLFHPTYYMPYFLEHLGERPFVVTVYDMIHELFPQMFGKNDPTSERKKILVDRADRLIAISDSTKNDLVRICSVAPSKVDVVHLASSLDPAQTAPRPEWLPSRYVLFVGNRGGYKNFDRFARSMSTVMHEDADIRLVCGGGGPLTEAEQRLLKEIGIDGRTVQIKFDDPMLTCLYRNAEAFIFPSLYEGFGIPILESFSCGCPLLSSNTSSFPEVIGDAGVMFDPYDEAAMAETISKVLADAEMRQRMVDRGLARAKEFSWDKTAQNTREVYERIL